MIHPPITGHVQRELRADLVHQYLSLENTNNIVFLRFYNEPPFHTKKKIKKKKVIKHNHRHNHDMHISSQKKKKKFNVYEIDETEKLLSAHKQHCFPPSHQ